MAQTTLTDGDLDELFEHAAAFDEGADEREPEGTDTGVGREPVHVVYGGADRFKPDTPAKLGAIALRMLDAHAPDAATVAEVFGLDDALAGDVRTRVTAKLEREPVEDFRADFEDGFGERPDAEEDETAIVLAGRVAEAMDAGSVPAMFGIRVKSFTDVCRARAARTLDLFVTALAERTGGHLPAGFVVTLPKVEHTGHVASFRSVCERLEARLGLAERSLGIELMIETPGALVSHEGTLGVADLIDAADGRCASLHFGAYDYLSLLGIGAADQSLHHPACDFARSIMQVDGARRGVRLSDGATVTLPLGDDPGAIRAAWRLAYNNVRRSLANGLFQGWDLHPGQLISRYAAVDAYFAQHKAGAATRMINFLDAATKATNIGTTFDDAATAQGLLAFFRRGIACGALDEAHLADAGLTPASLQAQTFTEVIASRSHPVS
ncbi:MAG: phosphoenolpyruvate kinase [Planctomycetota bacterium]